MKKFSKTNIADITIEEAHGGSGKRQVLVKPEQLETSHLENVTKGYLKPGDIFPFHSHDGLDEIMIVLKGEGKFYCGNEVVKYKEDDVITIPAGSKHKIEAGGNITNEYYFIRVKVN